MTDRRHRVTHPSQLLSQDPPLRADDYVPALWVPIARRVEAQRRLRALTDRLPAAAWAAPSAIAGWSRKACLAHLASYATADPPIFRAVLREQPPRVWVPDPVHPDHAIEVWIQAEVSRRDGHTIAELREELDEAFAETLALLTKLDDDQVLLPAAYASHVLAAVDGRTKHMHRHASDIVNGPQMPRM